MIGSDFDTDHIPVSSNSCSPLLSRIKRRCRSSPPPPLPPPLPRGVGQRGCGGRRRRSPSTVLPRSLRARSSAPPAALPPYHPPSPLARSPAAAGTPSPGEAASGQAEGPPRLAPEAGRGSERWWQKPLRAAQEGWGARTAGARTASGREQQQALSKLCLRSNRGLLRLIANRTAQQDMHPSRQREWRTTGRVRVGGGSDGHHWGGGEGREDFGNAGKDPLRVLRRRLSAPIPALQPPRRRHRSV